MNTRPIKLRTAMYRYSDNKFSHFSYWGRILETENEEQAMQCFVSPSRCSFAYPVRDEQFTGLVDTLGNEIYEGDIIDDALCRVKVIWNEKDACFCQEFDDGKVCDLNSDVSNWGCVVGNIHEN